MRHLLSLLLCLLITGQVFADGKIVGTVTDGGSSETLIGVSVSLMQKGGEEPLSGTITDIDGNFSFEVAPGDYEIEVKYVGYQAKRITDINVTEGNTTKVSVAMSEPKNTQLEEVVIQGTIKKETVNALFTMQKNAIAVSSGISADLIRRSPDKNTGEVLKRVSGASVQDNKFVVVRGLSDRYNTALINNTIMPTTEPNRKAFSFDIIPSSLIDNLIVSKTATPELPGDFAGGVIQVFTKDIPDENFVNVNISLGYNTQSTFKDFLSNGHGLANNFGFDTKDRKLTSSFGNNYDYYKRLSRDQQIAAAKTLKNNFVEKQTTALPVQSYQVSWGNAKYFKNGGKFGSVIALNYRRSESINQTQRRRLISDYTWNYDYPIEDRYAFSVNAGAMANFAYSVGKTKIGFKNLYNRIYDDVYYKRNGYNVSNVQQQNLISSVPMERGLLNSQLEGEHAFGKSNSKIYWNLNYSNLSANQNDLRTAFYSRPFSLDPDNGTPSESPQAPYEIVDRNSRRFYSNMKDNNYGANATFTTYFNLFNQKQTFKAGYYLLNRNRDFKSRIFNYQAADQTSFDKDLGTLPVDQIFAAQNMSQSGFLLNEFTNPNDAYKVSGLLNAGFLMLDNKLTDKIRLIWGARLEAYNQTLDIFNQSAIREKLKQNYVDVLPSVNLSYSLTDKSNIRLAASQTVSRPEFWEIAPFSFFDFDNNWVVDGNPNLQRGKITNLDLRYELYPKGGEAFTVSAFYKHFDNPIETYLQNISGDADYISYFNSESARSIGVELEVRKSLSFLGEKKWMENTILAGNVAYINSDVNVGSFAGAKDRPMMGQSPYLVNLSAQYSDPVLGFSTTLLYNRIGQRIAIVGNGSRPNIFENGRNMLDFQISKAVLKKNGEVRFTIGDILNSPYVFYQDMNYDNKAYQANDGTLTAKSGDSIFRKYKMGTTFTLAFTYNLKFK